MSLVINQRYAVLRWVGRGEMGQVLEVADLRRPGLTIALKALRDPSPSPETEAQFAKEFLALSDLDHPALARAWDFDKIGSVEGQAPEAESLCVGQVFFTRELVNGKPLLEATEDLGFEARLRVLWQLAHALAYIHDQGLLHRDLKPDNLFVSPRHGRRRGGDPGAVRVLDFGFVSDFEGADVRAGTALYLAPEVLRGERATMRSELYALGLLVYEVLHRTHPLVDYRSTVDVAKAHLTLEIPPLEGVPVAVSALVAELVNRDPEARPASARVAAQVLANILGEGLGAPAVGAARLVGRRAELARLRELVESRWSSPSSAVRGHELPAAVVLTGPPGAGKSRVVRWLRSWAQVKKLRTFGQVGVGETGAATGWRGLFREVLSDRRSQRATPYLDMLKAAVREQVVDWAGPLAPDDAWTRLREAGVALLAEEGRARPILLIFEDLHRADAETLEWFEYLSRNLVAGNVSLMGTAWPPGPTAETIAELREGLEDGVHAQWMTLEGLGEGETQLMVRRLLGVTLQPEVARRLREHTDGNPLFLEELLRAAGSVESLLQLIDADRVPGAVGEAARAQLASLPPDTLRCLEALSVLGRPAAEERVARVLDAELSRVARGLQAATMARLIREEAGQYWFVHATLAQVCGGEANDPRFRLYHRRAANLSDDTADPLSLRLTARHWRRAGEPEKAVEALLEGASLAERRFQMRLAIELYTGALEILDAAPAASQGNDAGTRWLARSHLARVLMWSGAYRRAEAEATALLETAPPPEGFAEGEDSPAALWSLLGQTSTRQANYERALECFGKALEQVQGSSAAEILDHMAEVHLRRGDTDAAQDACDHALLSLGAAAGGPLEHANLRGAIATHLGRVAQERGAYELALGYLEQARGLYSQVQNLRGSAEVLAAIAGIREVRNEADEAVAAHEESLAMSDRAGDVEATANALQRLSMAHYMAGNVQQGVVCLERSLELYRQLNNPQGEARALNGLGLLNHVRGAYRDSIAARRAAIEKQQALGDVTGLAMTRANLAILYFQIGALSQAVPEAEAAMEAIKATGQKLRVARCRYILGMVSSASGDSERGQRELEASVVLFEALGAADFVSAAQSGLAEHWLRVGDHSRALQASDAAMSHALSLGKPALMQVLVTRARVLLAAPETDTEAALQVLADARVIATKLTYADILSQVFELWGRLLLKAGRPGEACGWLTRAMDMVFACHQQLPEELQEAFVSDPRRQVLRHALQLALRQAQRGGRRRGRERHEPGIL